MTSHAGSIVYLLQFIVVSVSPSVNTVFVCRDSCILYQLDLNQKSSDTHTHAETLCPCFYIFIFVHLLLIVCLYAICCSLYLYFDKGPFNSQTLQCVLSSLETFMKLFVGFAHIFSSVIR